MPNHRSMFRYAAAALLALGCGHAAATAGVDAGVIKTVKGTATVVRGAETLPVTAGMALKSADQVKTGADGAVGITLRDNTVLSAGANSTLSLDKFSFDNKTQKGELEATLKRGSLSAISGAIAKSSPNAVQFKTSTMTLGVRGTDFIIEAADRGE